MTLKELYDYIGKAIEKNPRTADCEVKIPSECGYSYVNITNEDLLFMYDDDNNEIVIRSDDDNTEDYYDRTYDLYFMYRSSLDGKEDIDRRSICLEYIKNTDSFDEEYVNNLMQDIPTMIINAKANNKSILDIPVIGKMNSDHIRMFLEDLDVAHWYTKASGDRFTLTVMLTN